MRLLVTGGSGFTGRHLLPLLVKEGHEVVALVRSPEAAETVRGLGAEPLWGDLDDPASVDTAFQSANAEALINVASLGFGHAPAIVAAAEEAGIERAVFVSTTAIFTSLPAPSKRIRLTAEETIAGSALRWTILRPTMIYGNRGDRNMCRLLQVLRRSPVVPIPGHGNGLHQPVHVDDLAGAIAAAVQTDSAVGNAYDIAGPDALSLNELVQTAAKAVGRTPTIIRVPLRPAIALVRLYERAVPRPRLKAEQLERLAEDKAFDISAARADLGYSPRPFSTGITEEAGEL